MEITVDLVGIIVGEYGKRIMGNILGIISSGVMRNPD